MKGVEWTVIHGGFYDGSIVMQWTFLQPIKKHSSRVSVIEIDECEDNLITGEDKGAFIFWSIDDK